MALVAMENVIRCIIFCILYRSTAEDEWNSKDYLKREYSLVKPYSGFIMLLFVVFSTSAFDHAHLNIVVASHLSVCAICELRRPKMNADCYGQFDNLTVIAVD